MLKKSNRSNSMLSCSLAKYSADVRVATVKASEDRPLPVVFASACCDGEGGHGGWKYSGGVKELNLLVKLLRDKEYEAYVVTYDGTYTPWLIDHQPHISLHEFYRRTGSTRNIRCVTSLANAEAFIKGSKDLWFWDMDLCHTEHSHYPLLAELYKHKLRGVAAISRTIQAWHMSNFGKPCTVLPNLLDTDIWSPVEAKAAPYLIGYMDEGPHTEEVLRVIRDAALRKDVSIQFLEIEGDEGLVLESMRSCNIFLSMNIGKDRLWGEGCPRTIIEALSVGCVVIAFDIIGNREILINHFNGIIVQRGRPDLMADSLLSLLADPEQLEQMRNNSRALINSIHTLESRWPAVKEFLSLP